MQLGEILIEQGRLESSALERALKAQQELGDELSDILVKLGMLSEDDLAAALAQQYALPLAKSGDYPGAPLYLSKVSVNFLKSARVVPLREQDNELALAMVDPTDEYAIRAMEMLSGLKVLPWVATPKQVQQALETLYGDGRSSLDRIIDDVAQEGVS
ncbi:MAG: type II secretion system protein GspE, partial [Gammaproteobacteria bacterium]|nr:type II secretion system protein GspE [Gammaproteobacteria bacterium]